MRKRKASHPFSSRGVIYYSYGRLCPINHPRAIAEWYASGCDKTARFLDFSTAEMGAPFHQARNIELE